MASCTSAFVFKCSKDSDRSLKEWELLDKYAIGDKFDIEESNRGQIAKKYACDFDKAVYRYDVGLFFDDLAVIVYKNWVEVIQFHSNSFTKREWCYMDDANDYELFSYKFKSYVLNGYLQDPSVFTDNLLLPFKFDGCICVETPTDYYLIIRGYEVGIFYYKPNDKMHPTPKQTLKAGLLISSRLFNLKF